MCLYSLLRQGDNDGNSDDHGEDGRSLNNRMKMILVVKKEHRPDLILLFGSFLVGFKLHASGIRTHSLPQGV